jgi:hypothetical protein
VGIAQVGAPPVRSRRANGSRRAGSPGRVPPGRRPTCFGSVRFPRSSSCRFAPNAGSFLILDCRISRRRRTVRSGNKAAPCRAASSSVANL